MNSLTSILLVTCSVVTLAAAEHIDLRDKYPFSTVLFNQGEQYYELHWNFTRATETIYFAVNVSTTGWVGFGLSPTGAMVGSDVVIGWVAGGNTYFADRYAEAQSLPPIDPSQDWFLENSEEENGFTLLEFSRNLTTCDDRDLDITTSTARIIWSYSFTDPPNPSGEGANGHDHRFSASINLIGGNPSNNPGEELFLDVAVSNVTIPTNSTTYWCQTSRLPAELASTRRYINRISPEITPHASSFVHHMLVYLCPTQLGLTEEHVGLSGHCQTLPDIVRGCLVGLLIGGWAVGGDDFVYPEGVAYPIGGTGTEHKVIIQMHYDNPNNMAGVVDSSGLRFYYTGEVPAQRAGIMFLGHDVTQLMVVPPGTANYTVTGICSSDCTRSYIPEEGIRVFANLLHTHLVGIGLTLEHYRYNSECGKLEELEPIDQNLRYDFNFQQFNHLPKEHLILPNDTLVLKCFYNTTRNDRIVLGGESTLEEMCLSFLVYYPRPDDGTAFTLCTSDLNPAVAFNNFNQDIIGDYPDVPAQLTRGNTAALNDLDWRANPALVTSLENSVVQSNLNVHCRRENFQSDDLQATIPEVQCPYQGASKCSTVQPRGCCVAATGSSTVPPDVTTVAGSIPQVEINKAFSLLFLFVSILMAY